MKQSFKVLVLIFTAVMILGANVFAEEHDEGKAKQYDKKGTVQIMDGGLVKLTIPEEYRDADIKISLEVNNALSQYVPKTEVDLEDGECIILLPEYLMDVFKGDDKSLVVDYGKDDKGAVYDIELYSSNGILDLKKAYEFNILQEKKYQNGPCIYYLRYSREGVISGGLMRRNYADGVDEYLGIHDVNRIIYGDQELLLIEKLIGGNKEIYRVDLNLLKESKIDARDLVCLSFDGNDGYFLKIKDNNDADIIKISKTDKKETLLEEGINYNPSKSLHENFSKDPKVSKYLVEKSNLDIKSSYLEEDQKIKKELGIKTEEQMELSSIHSNGEKLQLVKAPNFMGWDNTYKYYHDGEVYILKKDNTLRICQENPCRILRKNILTGETNVIQEDVIFENPDEMYFKNVRGVIKSSESCISGGILEKHTLHTDDRWEVLDFIKKEVDKSEGKGSKVILIDSKVGFNMIYDDMITYVKSINSKEGSRDKLSFEMSGIEKKNNNVSEFIVIELNWR